MQEENHKGAVSVIFVDVNACEGPCSMDSHSQRLSFSHLA